MLFRSYQYPQFLFPGTSQKTEGERTDLPISPTISSVNPFSWRSTAKKIIAERPTLVIIRYWLPFMAPALGTIAKILRRRKIKVIAITDNIFGAPISKEVAREKLKIQSNDKVILFFGFIRAYKGLDLLIEAMGQPEIQKLNIKLLIAGEFYEDSKPYLEKIKSIDKGDRFILHTHYIGKEEVKNYFCASDLIVQPYKHATQSGITQIAYHFGRPMLVTDVGGLSEIVAHERVGYVVEKKSEAIANAISDFYLHQRESEFSRNVLIDSHKFSWKNFINGILQLNQEIEQR